MTRSEKTALFTATINAFMVPFMMSGINIALPSIEKEFMIDAVILSWVATSYILSTAIFFIPAGRAADILGRKKLFTAGTALFTIATLLCGISPSITLFILFRIFQGFGAALIGTTSIAILTSVFPAEQRGRVLGINVAATYIGLSLGPFISGMLIEYLGWRSIFIASVPLGLLSIYMSLFRLEGEWADARGEKFDFTGSLIYGAGLVSVMYGVTNLVKPWGPVLFLSGIAILFVFISRERRITYPVFEMSLFMNNRTFTFSNLAALINYSATFAITFFMSLYLQHIKGLAPSSAGLVLLAQPVVQAVFSPLAGRLSDRIDPGRIASAGMGINAVGLFLLININNSSSILFITVCLVIMGFGFALFSSPNTNAIMSSVEKKHYGIASGSVGTMRMLGMMCSMAIATLIFSVLIGRNQISTEVFPEFLRSMRIAFSISALLCLTGIFFSLSRGRIRG